MKFNYYRPPSEEVENEMIEEGLDQFLESMKRDRERQEFLEGLDEEEYAENMTWDEWFEHMKRTDEG